MWCDLLGALLGARVVCSKGMLITRTPFEHLGQVRSLMANENAVFDELWANEKERDVR